MAAEAEAYRKDLKAAVERSIALSPVVLVRDGTYRSFIPFACYVRGFASGAWSWRRPGSGAHVGGLYWDTIQSAESLISPAALYRPTTGAFRDTWMFWKTGLFLENPKVAQRTPGFDPEKHWFAHAGWQYQSGLERHANIHLAADDAPNFLRSWLNQYAVIILPEHGYIFREHTTGGPPDKIFEEAAFLERFRHDAGDGRRRLALARAGDAAGMAGAGQEDFREERPDAISARWPMRSFPTWTTARSPQRWTCHRAIRPSRCCCAFRHPKSLPIKSVTVNGKPWSGFRPAQGNDFLARASGDDQGGVSLLTIWRLAQ